MGKIKTDEEFLDFYCQCADIMFGHDENEIMYIKDANHNFRYLSLGHKKHVGKNAYFVADETNLTPEMKELHAKLKLQAYEQDNKVRSSLKSANFIYIDTYDRIAFVRKKPVVNPDTGNCVGVSGVVRPYSMPNILAAIYKINEVALVKEDQRNDPPPKYLLNEKQSMVLFLYINKYSNTEISEILTVLGHKISKHRVNDHLESLKFIFNVQTKEQLIKKAIVLDYHLVIPRKLLKIGSYEIDEEIIISGEDN